MRTKKIYSLENLFIRSILHEGSYHSQLKELDKGLPLKGSYLEPRSELHFGRLIFLINACSGEEDLFENKGNLFIRSIVHDECCRSQLKELDEGQLFGTEE